VAPFYRDQADARSSNVADRKRVAAFARDIAVVRESTRSIRLWRSESTSDLRVACRARDHVELALVDQPQLDAPSVNGR
jgi:hypothetical protein